MRLERSGMLGEGEARVMGVEVRARSMGRKVEGVRRCILVWLMGCDGNAVGVGSSRPDGNCSCSCFVCIVFVGDIAVVIRGCRLVLSILQFVTPLRSACPSATQFAASCFPGTRSAIDRKVVSSTVSCKIANVEEARMRRKMGWELAVAGLVVEGLGLN